MKRMMRSKDFYYDMAGQMKMIQRSKRKVIYHAKLVSPVSYTLTVLSSTRLSQY